MKDILVKSALALAISSVAVPVTSMAQTTSGMAAETEAPGVTVSGRYRAGVVCEDDSGDDDCGLENRSSRFRIAASQDMGNGISAFGKYEFGVALDEGRLRGGLSGVTNVVDANGNLIAVTGNPDNTRRLSYLGVKGGFGEISMGSRWTPMYNYISSPVDPTQLLGGTWDEGTGFITSFRRGDSVNYKHGIGDGGEMHLMLVLDDDDEDNDFVDEGQLGFRLNAGPLGLAIVHQSITDGDDTTGLNVSGSAGPVGYGLSYFLGENGDALAGTVGFGAGGGKINLGFGMDMPDDGPEPTAFNIEYAKQMTKHARWFAGAETVDTDSDADDITRFGVGMRLEF